MTLHCMYDHERQQVTMHDPYQMTTLRGHLMDRVYIHVNDHYQYENVKQLYDCDNVDDQVLMHCIAAAAVHRRLLPLMLYLTYQNKTDPCKFHLSILRFHRI